MKVYLTTAEAAKYTHLSKSLLDKYRVSGQGPKFIKIGTAIRYDSEDVDCWMRQHIQEQENDGTEREDT